MRFEQGAGARACGRGAGALAFIAVAAVAIVPAHAQWQPGKNVELVAPAAAGSALDSMARLLQRVIHDQRLSPANITVVNKAGGGNAVGFSYLAPRAGDGNYLLVTPFTIITNRITGANPLNYQDFTPLAMLADEHIGFVVNANSPLKTGRDLVERLKKDPESVSMALASALGNANHIAVSLVGKAAGADSKRFKIAVFNSSGESLTAVLGGHVDLAITTTGLISGQIQSGRIRVLAVAARERLSGALAQVPTWREQGIDVVFSSWRALIGPRGMSAAQIAYWESVVAQAVAQDAWKRELEKSSLTPAYAGSEATKQLFARQAEQLRAILADLGLAK
jgi:putative tricarboxylic transport membrane protein